MQTWFIGTGLVILIILVGVVPQFELPLSQLLGGFGRDNGDSLRQLALEATALKATLANIKEANQYAGVVPHGAVLATIYSRYPFNFKNIVELASGAEQGVEIGAPVFALSVDASSTTHAVLIGRVSKVLSGTATVQTVFDPAFRVAVRVGEDGIDALLVGGPEPRLTLIPKNVSPKSGEAVYTASSDFAYGLPLAVVASVSVSQNQIFQESTLTFAYDLNNIKTVAVGKVKK